MALTHAPSVWISLSFETREELVRKVCEVAPRYIAAMIDEMKASTEHLWPKPSPKARAPYPAPDSNPNPSR